MLLLDALFICKQISIFFFPKKNKFLTMEKILSFKEKFEAHGPGELIDTSIRKFSHIYSIINTDLQRLTKNEATIQTLTLKLHQTKDKIAEEEKNNELLLDKLREHEEIIKNLWNEFDILTTENKETMIKNSQLARKLSKPSRTDENILENGRKKLDYYKVLTGIRWDYPRMKTNIKGYVTNKDDYVHAFCLENDDEKSEEKLWLEVAKGCIRLNESEIKKLAS